MFAKDYRKLAWSKLNNNWAVAILSYLLFAVIIGVASSTAVGALFLYGILGVGFAGIMLNIIRSRQTKVEDLFDGFREGIINNMVAGLLILIFVVLWSLLFFIPGIVKSYSYSMTYYIMKDHPQMSSNDAITESRRMMNGNKWRLFCLDFSFIGWIILCILTGGILTILVAPYIEAAHAAFYESLKNPPYEVEPEANDGNDADFPPVEP